MELTQGFINWSCHMEGESVVAEPCKVMFGSDQQFLDFIETSVPFGLPPEGFMWVVMYVKRSDMSLNAAMGPPNVEMPDNLRIKDLDATIDGEWAITCVARVQADGSYYKYRYMVDHDVTVWLESEDV